MGEHEASSPPQAPVRHKGTVKWFHASKGFGFITPEEGEEELFVHQSTIKAEGFRSLREGELVEYDMERGEDGRNKAVNVTGPNGAPPIGSPPVSPYAAPPFYPHPHYAAAYHMGHRRPEAAAPPGGGYSGYYVFYPPGPRFPGAWSEGMMAPMISRPPRGMPRQMMPYRPPLQSGKTSGVQVVVHNLPWSCTWQRLKETFNQWEVERADVIVDDFGRSRGFGTVRFTSEEDASAAIEAINGTEMDGRRITVRLDRYA